MTPHVIATALAMEGLERSGMAWPAVRFRWLQGPATIEIDSPRLLDTAWAVITPTTTTCTLAWTGSST